MNPRTQPAVIERRRGIVAQLTAKGLSIREIEKRLADAGEVNPETNLPWGKNAIHGDRQALQAQWRKTAAQTIEDHKAQMLAELTEVKRYAWKKHDLRNVLEAVKQIRAMLGLDAPTKVETQTNITATPATPALTWEQQAARVIELLQETEARLIAEEKAGAVEGVIVEPAPDAPALDTPEPMAAAEPGNPEPVAPAPVKPDPTLKALMHKAGIDNF